MKDPFVKLVEIIKKTKIDCKFTLVDIGARPERNSQPRFHKIIEHFPSSEIIGFEIEKEVCDQMNSKAIKGIKYFPFALGKKNEKRKLYITESPLCTSLYKPDEKLLNLYHELQYMNLKKETEIETITLDSFVDEYSINTIDFIKIDVQGAELDIFKGSTKLLNNVLKIVCEVEFLPLYHDQPLFGDITQFLGQYNFMFNKFLGLSGRTLKPLIANKDKSVASQHMWTDAIFIQHINKIQNLTDERNITGTGYTADSQSFTLTAFVREPRSFGMSFGIGF